MRLLRELVFSGEKPSRIQICEGDLTKVPDDWATDILGVSAFDADYLETASSLIGALGRAHVHVGDLRKAPEAYLNHRHCWLSKPLLNPPKGVPFSRIVCTETPRGATPREAAGYLLMGLYPFFGEHPELTSVTVPVLGSGDQGADWNAMLTHLVREAAKYLKGESPIKLFRIVVRDGRASDAVHVFDELLKGDTAIQTAYDRTEKYEVFISYSRQDVDAVIPFHARFEAAGLSVFRDITSLRPGDTWAERIDLAIAQSRLFVAFVSERFNESVYCLKEADLADRLDRTGSPSIYPIRLSDVVPEPPLQRRHAPMVGNGNTVETLCDDIRHQIQGALS